MRRSRELAELLLQKAARDEFVVHKLISDPASPDDVIGFHAQQAIEKMFKAVLAFHAVRFGKIHDLGVLLDLLREHRIAFPSEFEELRRLTPFAADFRYEEVPPEQAILRSWVADGLRRVKAWAEAAVQQKSVE